MDYGEIITRAWHITWNNKFLWVLGFLAALTSAGSNSNSFQSSFDQTDFANNPDLVMQMTAMAMVLVCVFMILGLVLWLLSIVARGGLIDGVNRIDDGEKITLGEAFAAGTSAIWRLIGIYLLAFLPIIVIGLIVGAIAIAGIGGTAVMGTMAQNPDEIGAALAGSMGLLVLCLCLFICALIPFSVVITMIVEFATRGTIIQKLGVVESLSHGWRVFKDNLGSVILLWLILLAIGIGVGFALSIVMVPLALVVMVPVFTSIMNDGAMGGMSIAYMAISSLCLGIFGALLMSVVQTWTSAIWTLAYKEFTGKAPDHISAEKFA